MNNNNRYDEMLKAKKFIQETEQRIHNPADEKVNKYGVKLKSEMYNHENERIVRREEKEEKKEINDNQKILLVAILVCVIFFVIFLLLALLTR